MDNIYYPANRYKILCGNENNISTSSSHLHFDYPKEKTMNISIETYTHLKDVARKDLILAEFLAQLQKDNSFNFVTDFEKFPAIMQSSE